MPSCQGQQPEEKSVASSRRVLLVWASAKPQDSHRHQSDQAANQHADHQRYRAKKFMALSPTHCIFLAMAKIKDSRKRATLTAATEP